jgi:hypothetical protein
MSNAEFSAVSCILVIVPLHYRDLALVHVPAKSDTEYHAVRRWPSNRRLYYASILRRQLKRGRTQSGQRNGQAQHVEIVEFERREAFVSSFESGVP